MPGDLPLDFPLDSIRRETHGMTPTLGLIKTMTVENQLRRVFHHPQGDRG